jgi:hypothetical protein
MKRYLLIIGISIILYCTGYVCIYRFENFNGDLNEYDRKYSGIINAPPPPFTAHIPGYRFWYIRFRQGDKRESDTINCLFNSIYSPMNFFWRKIEV